MIELSGRFLYAGLRDAPACTDADLTRDLILAGPSTLEAARAAVQQTVAEAERDLPGLARRRKIYPLEDVRALAPIPFPHRNVFCIGRNYFRHIEESAQARGVEPKAEHLEFFFWLSQGTTLEPGDILLTGTPEGVGNRMTPPTFLKPGDVVEAEIERIGTLRTYIIER